MLKNQHLLLLILWVLYCTIHSVLAYSAFKNFLNRILGQWFRYYRLAYSFFAFITLAGILLYQFTIKSVALFNVGVAGYITGVVLLIPGLCIMIASIWKYFYELSGIQALGNKNPEIHLQEKGLHRLVRHPLYLGTLLSVWGAFLFFPFLSNLISCIVMQLYVLLGIVIEEKKLVTEFGKEYTVYSTKVPKLIPKLWAAGAKK